MRHITIALLLAATSVLAAEYYVEVPFKDAEDLKIFTLLELDVGGINLERKTATLVVPEEELPRTRRFRVVSQRKVEAPDPLFKKYPDVERALKEAANVYPHLATLESIGKSLEGREIWALNLTARFVVTEQPKKAVLFDAMHHAREVMTPEVALDIVDYLTKNYATDAKVQKWLNSYSIWVVPMLNPDGNNKVWTSSSMWRKNNRDGHGVDINRNYPYEWNSCSGSSGNPQSDTYRGKNPGSEPETQAIMGLVSRIRPMFNISYHSYSEIVIYPFGCDPKKIPSPDREVYEGVGRELGAKLVRDSGSGTYTPGTSYELLYNVDGGSVDWMYATEKVMSFVVEVNSSSQGFQPSYDTWREVTVNRQRAGWQYILNRMEGPGLPSRK